LFRNGGDGKRLVDKGAEEISRDFIVGCCLFVGEGSIFNRILEWFLSSFGVEDEFKLIY
jgi:hypothetical protein